KSENSLTEAHRGDFWSRGPAETILFLCRFLARVGDHCETPSGATDLEPDGWANLFLYRAMAGIGFGFGKEPVTENKNRHGLIGRGSAALTSRFSYRHSNPEVSLSLARALRYDAVNAMLLNEFLKQHRKVEEQEATIVKQQKQIDALTAGLQKVSDQLEVSKA